MDIRILNEGRAPDGEASAASLGNALAALRNVLEAEALVDGRRVDYGRLPGSPAYASLTERSRMLTGVLPESFGSDAERIAFWLNLYNVLSIHGVVAMGIRQSVMEIPSFFVRVAYRVGPYTFCLDDMSNGVLRRAARTPATGRRQFRTGDPRMAYCPTTVDPRIHGALVCAAASCPPVAFYAAERLDAQLDLAAANFVTQLVRIDPQRREVHLPLQFYYYVQDFGGAPGIAHFLLRHLPEPDRSLMGQALEGHWRIRWDPYDWGLNARI